MKNRIIALFLTVAALVGLAVPVSAAKEEFISDIALVYEDSLEDARKAVKDTEWKLFEENLNPDADYIFNDGVYIVYKTTTDVEEAITDLRVMDMYGGFSISDYERQLNESRDGYTRMVREIRILAKEFKALYDAGDEMAHLAHRQMNYYQDTWTKGGDETNMLMGDFFLAFAANVDTDGGYMEKALVQVLMEGNSTAAVNLFTLLAIGISGAADQTLSEKVAENYAKKDSLSAEEYYEAALNLSEKFEALRPTILRYDALMENSNLSDETITDEEYKLLTQYMPLATMLGQIMLGDKSLADILREGEWKIEDLYPVTASLTPGQTVLISIGQLETVLKYSTPSKPIDELTEAVEDIEQTLRDDNGVLQPISVYLGVDRSVFDGAFAMTTAADRQQALTGKTWDMDSAHEDTMPLYIAAGALFAVDFALAATVAGILIKYQVLKHAYNTLRAAVKTVDKWQRHIYMNDVVGEAMLKYQFFGENWFPVAKVLGGVCAGVSLLIAGLSGIGTWYNYYNPDYTEIPGVMVDVRETDAGDKYVKYTAAKVYGEKDKNADFNAYEGKEWIALYYTKDATAGSCLTPNFKLDDLSSKVARRHQGISMFGESEAFNLNSHVYNDGAPAVYLSVRYSNTKKAAADMPDVVGAMLIQGGLYAITAISGGGIGAGIMAFIYKKKKDCGESSEEESPSEK